MTSTDPSSSGIAARKAALRLLAGIFEEQKLLSELIAGPSFNRLKPEDRARASRIAQMALRGKARADTLIKQHVKKRPPDAVQNMLRLATVELCDGAAAHGVVNDYVQIAQSNPRTRKFSGLMNAVLRKVAEEGPKKWGTLAPSAIPRWLRQPLVEAWGAAAMQHMEAAFAKPPPTDLTAKGAPEALAEATGGTLTPTGSVRLTGPVQISALPGFDEGTFWVQDAAAALPARILAAQPGENVLDMCAAPGGKTLQLAAAGARVTALDSSAKRLRRVHENLERTGLSAEVVTQDARAFEQGGFDAILLDAPCSATGTIRRHPDLPFAKDGIDFMELFALQAELIDHAAGLLRPGGRLVFCTCSLFPDEGEVQVEEALERHPELTIDRAALAVPGVDSGWITEEGGLRLRPDYWPEIGGMDGFYIACLTKPA